MLFLTTDYDLSRAAKELERKSKFKAVATLINQRHALLSVNRDMIQANQIWDAMNAYASALLPPPEWGEKQDESQGLTIASFINNAIFKYTAAMHTRSANSFRWLVGLPEAGPEVRSAHKRICAIRDTALAHYGEGPAILARPWNMDAVVMTLSGTSLSTVHAWQRTNYLQEVAEDLGMVVIHARVITDARVKDGQAEFDRAITDAMADAEFAGTVAKYPFQTKDRFHSFAGSVAALNGLSATRLHRPAPAYKSKC